MKLTIHATGKPINRPAAAFIRGGNAAMWLSEISRYHLPFSAMEGYVLPQSIQSITPAGLLVIFKTAGDAEKLLLPDTYGVLAGKLYLPVDAILSPQLSAAELEKILLWPVQVFHPTIGFVGFEEKDKLDFTRLFAWTLPQKTTWRHAHAGLPARPGLQQITVLQPTPEEIIEQAKEELQVKPLENIPGGKKAPDTLTGKIAEGIKDGFFTGLSAITQLLNKLPLGEGGSADGDGKGSWLQRLTNWVDRNMEEIEKKRQTELQRLMNLFDKDTDEALQYAIPLSSPYLDRGQAPPSATLGRRNTSFSLGGLGGGGRIDGWDLGDYYQRLREKYLASAQTAIDKGDFKKAAYVHAHLLGDYNAAANVLMQGGFYREAAALYKDHLKNNLAAAECLEKGGLLAEATALYLQMDRLEKAGDLYGQMQQPAKATACYEQVVGNLISSNDQLEAARIIQHKIQQEARARQTLLQGWESGNKAEACLKKYYDLIAETEGENLEQHLEAVYAKAPAADSRFLNVLVHVRERYVGVEATSKKMAYEIVSRQAAEGITTNLHQLKSFLPKDKFISGDASRFISRQKKPQISKPQEGIKLDETIKWEAVTTHRTQLLAIGVKNGIVHFARANWYGTIDYSAWPGTLSEPATFRLLSNPVSPYILMRCSGNFSIDDKVLPKTKHFSEGLVLTSPAFIAAGGERWMVQNEGFSTIEGTYKHASLKHYAIDGKLMSSIHCYPSEGEAVSFQNQRILDYWSGYFTTNSVRHIVLISSNGGYTSFDADGDIQAVAISKLSATFWVVVSTNVGCHLLTAKNGKFQSVTRFETPQPVNTFRFVTADKFVAVEKFRATLYEIDVKQVVQKEMITTDSPIIEAIPVPHQNHFGLVHQNGIVSLHPL